MQDTRRYRFGDYALFARDDATADSWLAGHVDGKLGLLRLEFWYGLAADESLTSAARRFLELELGGLPVVPLIDGGADSDRGFFVRRLPGGVSLEQLTARMQSSEGRLPYQTAARLSASLAAMLLAMHEAGLSPRWTERIGVDWDGRFWLDLPSVMPDVHVERMASTVELDDWLPGFDALLDVFFNREPGFAHMESLGHAHRLYVSSAASAEVLGGFLQATFRQEREAEAELREEIALLTAEVVDTWPVVRAIPSLPMVT